MTLYQIMENTARQKGNEDSIVFYGKRYSFSRVLSYVDKAAAGLRKSGVKKGDTVTLCMPNTPSAQIAFYAINKIGAIVNLVHPKIAPVQLLETLKKTDSAMLIVYDLYLADLHTSPFYDDLVNFLSNDTNGGANCNDNKNKILMSKSDYFMGVAAKAYFKFANRKKKPPKTAVFEKLLSSAPDNETAEFDENEPAVYLPSGGTTGNPKIVMHSNKAFISLCGHGQYFLSDEIKNFEAMYTVLPIFHGFGLCMNMLMCAQHGLKNVMSIKFSPKHIAKSIKKENVNIIMGVPSMFNKLIKNEHFNRADLSPLKDCFVGGDNVPAKQIIEFEGILRRQGSRGGLYIGYGLTETVTVCVVNNSAKNKTDSVGAPLPDCEIKIFSKDLEELKCGEIGEIGIKTPIMMLGYLGGDFSPFKDINGERWLITGDLGYLDKEGFLFFKQRAKNMIKVSGIPVYPSEIEQAVQKIEGVTRAAAIGVDDTSAGQAVKLFVEVRDLANINPDELKQKIIKVCEQSLICYAVPKYIELRKNLPLNDIGKIDLNKL